MYPENPEGTQVIVGSMNMGYISDTDRNQILRKEISHLSLQLSKVLRVLHIFDFQWRFTTSIYRYFVPLQVKHSRLLWISRQPWETRSRRNMVMSVPGDQSHCIPFQPGSTIETIVKPRLDEKWVCQTLFMWIIFFQIVTLNLGVVNNNQLESIVTWYVFQYTISHMSDYSCSVGLWGRKVPRVIDLVRLNAACISNYVAVVAFFWRVLFFNDWSRYQRYHNPCIIHFYHSKGRYMKSFWRSEIFRIWLVFSSCSETQP